MENNNRKARIQTYLIALQNGDIKGNLLEVLDYIYRNQGATIHDMRTALAMAHQSLTPAVSNLLDAGLIYEIGQVRIGDSIYSKFSFEPDSAKQDLLAEFRKEDKYKQWVKHGLKEFGDLMTPQLITALKW